MHTTKAGIAAIIVLLVSFALQILTSIVGTTPRHQRAKPTAQPSWAKSLAWTSGQ